MKIPVWITSQVFNQLKTEEKAMIHLTEEKAEWSEHFDRVMSMDIKNSKEQVYSGTLTIEDIEEV